MSVEADDKEKKLIGRVKHLKADDKFIKKVKGSVKYKNVDRQMTLGGKTLKKT